MIGRAFSHPPPGFFLTANTLGFFFSEPIIFCFKSKTPGVTQFFFFVAGKALAWRRWLWSASSVVWIEGAATAD